MWGCVSVSTESFLKRSRNSGQSIKPKKSESASLHPCN